MACKKLSKESFKSLLESINTVLFDADGVLWHGNQPIPGSADAVKFFREQGKRVFLVSNNSSHSRREYDIKCKKLGFEFEKDHLVTTSAALADHLHRENFKGKVYIIGNNGIHEELDNVGIENFGVGSDTLENYSSKHELYNVPLDPEVKAVAVGIDQNFSYVKLSKAVCYLHNKECLFIATNDDSTFPGPNIPLPGAGSLVAAVQEAAGRKPLVLGKPNSPMLDYIQLKHGLEKEKTLMIGDRCNTDIKLANDNGMRSLLVMTGVTDHDKLAEIQKCGQSDLVPTFYTQQLSDILTL